MKRPRELVLTLVLTLASSAFADPSTGAGPGLAPLSGQTSTGSTESMTVAYESDKAASTIEHAAPR